MIKLATTFSNHLRADISLKISNNQNHQKEKIKLGFRLANDYNLAKSKNKEILRHLIHLGALS